MMSHGGTPRNEGQLLNGDQSNFVKGVKNVIEQLFCSYRGPPERALVLRRYEE